MNVPYTPAQRAEAVALATTIGPRRAAEKLGLLPRTVARWMHRPENAPAIAEAELAIAERLTAAHKVALASVLEGLADPRARLGDRANALRVLGEQAALAEGRATSRTESTSFNVNVSPQIDHAERARLAAFVDNMLARLDAGEIDGVERAVVTVLDAERSITRLIASGEAPDIPTAQALLEARHAGTD